MRSYYYLSNVRQDRFALEVRYLLPGYHEFGDLSNYVIVSSFFDVRVRLSLSLSSFSDKCSRRRRRRGRREAARAAVASHATIAAWSLSNGFGGRNDEEQKGKTTTALIEELGRATFAEEQDCKLVQDLIKKANDLMSSMVSAALKRPDKFIASLFYEECDDDSAVVDIAFSNHHHKKEEEHQFASDKYKDDYSFLSNNSDNNNNSDHNPAEDNKKENIHSMLAELAADTNRLFYSNYKKRKR